MDEEEDCTHSGVAACLPPDFVEDGSDAARFDIASWMQCVSRMLQEVRDLRVQAAMLDQRLRASR